MRAHSSRWKAPKVLHMWICLGADRLGRTPRRALTTRDGRRAGPTGMSRSSHAPGSLQGDFSRRPATGVRLNSTTWFYSSLSRLSPYPQCLAGTIGSATGQPPALVLGLPWNRCHLGLRCGILYATVHLGVGGHPRPPAFRFLAPHPLFVVQSVG